MNGRETGENPLAKQRQVGMVDVCSPTDSAAFSVCSPVSAGIICATSALCFEGHLFGYL